MLRAFVRGKKTTAINPSTQKVLNQLSAISANRKQPKLLNLCAEDLVKHKTITNAWKLFTSRNQRKRETQLKQQYESIVNAMEDLKSTSPALFEMANTPQKRKRWPLEMRVPTDYPANKPWVYEYSPYKKD
ncbi:large ribosomal subunit protein mL40 [Diutina catenulata]